MIYFLNKWFLDWVKLDENMNGKIQTYTIIDQQMKARR